MRPLAMTVLQSRVCRPLHYLRALSQRARMGGLWGRTLHRGCSQTAQSARVAPMMGSSHLIRRRRFSSIDLPTPTSLTRNVQLSKESTTFWALSKVAFFFLTICSVGHRPAIGTALRRVHAIFRSTVALLTSSFSIRTQTGLLKVGLATCVPRRI